MSKHFRPWKIDDAQLLPPSVQDYVAKEHTARFVVAIVRESLDLCEIEASYNSHLGQPPFHPTMMTTLLLNGYVSGIYSSRRIAKACTERADFMMIVAGDAPDFRTVSEFRKRHLKALAQLFVQVLELCEAAGLAKLGHVAFDGTKIKTNASKHKAMSYARMKQREAELQAEVDRWLAAAEAADAEEDARHGQCLRPRRRVLLRHSRRERHAKGARQTRWRTPRRRLASRDAFSLGHLSCHRLKFSATPATRTITSKRLLTACGSWKCKVQGSWLFELPSKHALIRSADPGDMQFNDLQFLHG
jgi:transposase